MSNLSAASGTWVIDPTHTNLGFSARHAMVAKVRGNFGEFSGSFTIGVFRIVKPVVLPAASRVYDGCCQ